MNGSWYSWGYRHTSPAAFVAAWRHIVTLFRDLGARNVTWLWTVNIINDAQQGTGSLTPDPWWPGNSYVNWVGIDGYYLKPSWQFAPLFGPTIAEVRALTSAPILIAETGAMPAAGQPARSPTCSPASVPTGCWGSSGSTPRTPPAKISVSAVPQLPRHSARVPGTFMRPGS